MAGSESFYRVADATYAISAAETWTTWVNSRSISTTTIDSTANTYYAGISESGTSITWKIWNSGDNSVKTFQTTKLTAEEILAAKIHVEEQHRIERARVAEETERRRLAEEKADALLAEFLEPMQRSQFSEKQSFIVVTESGRRYEIKRRQRVTELDGDGKAIASYCIHPRITVPSGDTMLAQKLMLETDEDQFLKTANRMAL